MKKLNLVDTTKFAARVIVKAFGNVLSLSNLKRLTVMHVISALLLPMFWFVAPQKASTRFAPAAITPPPPSAPPAAFLLPSNTSSNIFGKLFGASEDAGTNDKSRFSEFISVFKTPELPAGLEAGRVPTLTERLSESIKTSGAFAKVAPLFSNESAPPKAKITKAETIKAAKEDNSSLNKEIENNEIDHSESTEPATETDSEASTAPLSSPVGGVRFDFDSDGKADQARRKGSSGEWKIRNSTNGNVTTLTVGSSTSVLTPGDFDGDGKTDAAVFDAGTWTIKKSSDLPNVPPVSASWGTSGDKPVTGDYDGDGKSDLAIYRPSTNTWWILQSSNGATVSVSFGASGDILVPADYDGDGKTDVAVFRPSTGYWHVQGSAAGYFGLAWGVATDIPVPADFDGDGKTDFTVYRGSTGSWYSYKSSTNNGSFLSQNWGNYGDQPVPADYDGDGKDDFAVFRPNTGVWHIIKSGNSQYEYQTLGQAGDLPVNAAYLKQIGGTVHSYDLAKARLSPKNATGGTNLYSQNFSWGTSLVGLSGRAGLDAGFGISYNSLVWTKYTDSSNNSSVFFDTDNSNVGPGFRLGFSTIEPIYWDKNAQTFNYLMVTPSGARVEFRQVNGASDTFETADSSYLQLKTVGASNPNDPVENITITLMGTDGTKMTYLWKAGAFRCSEIKDRNGNYITINHDEQGLLRSVTDTLGRVINVNYDSELYPTSITQTWKDSNGAGSNVTHTWATFTYTTKEINTSFEGTISVFGPQNGTTLKVLQKITFPNGSSTAFDYNGYGQVWRVNNHAADNHKLNHISVNLQTPTAAQTSNGTDCPRFTETKSYIENFNNGNEVTVPNLIQENQTYNVPGVSGTATLVQATAPNGVVSKTYLGSSGWQEGLPIVTEDWVNEGHGLQRKRWTWMQYAQDDPNLGYILNPRVVESKVGDTTNVKRTTIDYHTDVANPNISAWGLVKEVKIYASNQTSVLKRVTTEYNLNSLYLDRRIIGLPNEQKLFDEAGVLMSKVTYSFDEGDFTGTEETILPIQHDNDAFGANFILGRGNLTSMTRWDVNASENEQAAVKSQTKYNTAGATVAQIDPIGRQVSIRYSDSFADGQSRNTFAYPTKMIDPAGNFSEVKYRFDIGANVWAKSPAPNGQTQGKITTRTFDSFGRMAKQKIENNGAYTRYEYPTNQISAKVFTTVTDANNDGQVNSSDEVLAESFADGAGRTRMSRSPLLLDGSGNTITWTGQQVEYDVMGRTKRQSVPTEIDNSWNPTGDDQTRGWQWTSAEYDWKGRITKEIGLDNVERDYSYDGCGCAGGEEVTMLGEELEPGKRRKQKIYSDILGRNWKTEVFNYDGSVYTTAVNNFNGRDQITTARQYEGLEGSGVYQEAINFYDGHGRLAQTHTPRQDENKFTSYTYFTDDRLHTVTDGRGAVSTYTYNNRALVERIEQAKPINQPTMPAFAPCEDGTQDCLIPENAAGGTRPPIGVLDYADTTTGKIAGWSVDLDSPGTSNQVHLYIDGTAGSGAQGFVVTADKPRPDVNTVVNVPGNHGFEFQMPESFADGKPHLIYAYGIDVVGGNTNPLLTNAPKSILVIPAVKVTEFEYDNLGNRTRMTDETGYTNYQYDSLSRMTSETKHLRDSWTIAQHDFTIQYAYNLTGQLKSVTDPFGERIDYGTDKTGKLKEITGTPFSSSGTMGETVTVTDYIDDIEYRAWGATKSIDYGNGTNSTQTFDNRLRISEFNLAKDGQTNSLIKKNYQYYNDNKVKFSSDSGDITTRMDSHRFDRSYEYDQMGRLTAARTGTEARGEPTTPDRNVTPYKQDYIYNAFGNVTSRQTFTWTEADNKTHSWTNNRESTWQYDADGRLKHTPENNYDYDGAGGIAAITLNNSRVSYNQTDGEGKTVRRDVYKIRTANGYNSLDKNEYYIYSSVLGKLLTEVKTNGTKKKTYIYGLGGLVATQNMNGLTTQHVAWENSDPANTSYLSTLPGGAGIYNGENGQAELDPLGSNVGTSNPYDTGNQSNLAQGPGGWGGGWGDPFGGYSCRIDGFEMPCSYVASAVTSGAGYFAPLGAENPFISNGDGRFVTNPIYGNPVSYGTQWWCCDNDGNYYPVPTAYGGSNESTSMSYISGISNLSLMNVSSNDFLPYDDLASFLENSKNCAGLLAALMLLLNKSGNLGDIDIINATGNSEVLDKTGEEIGGVYGEIKGTKLRDLRNPDASAEVIDGKVYVYDMYYNDRTHNTPTSRGAVIFHEILGHVLLGGGHRDKIETFNINYSQPPIPPIPDNFEPNKITRGKLWADKYKSENPQINWGDGGYSAAFQTWIENDCSN